MATERRSPDAIISSTGLDVSGGITVIQDDPDSPDGNWFTHTAKSGDLRISFPTPTGDPTTGPDVQEFRVLLRKDASGGGTPTYSAELRETGGGSALETLATSVPVTNSTGQVESLTWDATNLGTADGSAVELLLTFTGGGGGPNERSIEVGAGEWNVDYTSGTNVLAGTATLSLSTFAAGVSAATNVQAGTATLSLSTFAAGVSAATNVQAGTATLSLSTFAATVEVGGTNVQANIAALTLATYPATVDVGGQENTYLRARGQGWYRRRYGGLW